MVYGRLMFNNIKEYTPSWIKTIPYSQITKPTFKRGTQVVSKFNADPKVKRLWRMLQNNVQKYPALWQMWIFMNAFVWFQIVYWPWLKIYQLNNKHRGLDYALSIEKEHQRRLKEKEQAEAAEEEE